MKLPDRLISKYKDDTKYRFPSQDIDPEKKKKEYCKEYAESIFSMYTRGRTGIPYHLSNYYEENRLYGKGLQSTEKYKNELIQNDRQRTINQDTDDEVYTREERLKAWNNINWDNLSVLPKIKDHIHGLFDNVEYDVKLDAIDENSGVLKEQMKIDTLVNAIYAAEIQELSELAGIEYKPNKDLPETPDEVEMYEMSGGFKPNYCKGMEKLLQHTFDISQWDKTLKRKILDDFMDIGIAGVKDYYCEDSKKIKVKYIDPSMSVIQYSKQWDFDDSEYAGHIEYYSVSKLRQKGFTEEEIKHLAKAHFDTFNNLYKNDWNYYNREDARGWRYDRFSVPVLEAVWIDNDACYEKYQTNKYGRKRIKTVEYDKGAKGKVTKPWELRKKSTRYVYRCSWVIGTDYVFDYGHDHNQRRPTPSDVKLPYRFVLLTENPIVKRIRPIVDEMHIAWYKHQNALSLAPMPGYAINLRLLQNLELGGKKISIKDVFRIFRDTGHMFYSDTNATTTGRYEGGSVTPVSDLPGGMRNALMESVQLWDLSIKRIEDLTGLSPLSLGGTPSQDSGKATSEMSLSATRTIVRPIVDACFKLKEMVGQTSLLNLQLMLKASEECRRAYMTVVGRADVDVVVQAEQFGAMYGITMEARPDAQDKMDVLEAARMALQPKRNGEPQITLDQYLLLKEKLNSRANIRETRMYLAYLIKKNEQRALERQKINEQANTERAMAIEQQKSQSLAQMKQMEHQMEIEKQNNEHNNKMQHTEAESNLTMQRDVAKYAHEEEMQEEEFKYRDLEDR